MNNHLKRKKPIDLVRLQVSSLLTPCLLHFQCLLFAILESCIVLFTVPSSSRIRVETLKFSDKQFCEDLKVKFSSSLPAEKLLE